MKSALSIRCQATFNTNEAGSDNLLITPVGEPMCVCVSVCVCMSETAVLLAEAVKEPLLRQAQSRDKGRDPLLKAGLPVGLRNSHTHTGWTKDFSRPLHNNESHNRTKRVVLKHFFFFFLFNLFFPNQECTSFFLSLEVCWKGRGQEEWGRKREVQGSSWWVDKGVRRREKEEETTHKKKTFSHRGVRNTKSQHVTYESHLAPRPPLAGYWHKEILTHTSTHTPLHQQRWGS